MKELIDLLKIKNGYFDKLLLLNKSFRSKMLAGDFNDLSLFEYNRKKIINIIDYFDKKITAVTNMIPQNTQFRDDFKHHVDFLLDKKNELVKEIIGVDLDILQLIDKEKDKTIHNLKNVKQKQQTLKTYKPRFLKKYLDREV